MRAKRRFTNEEQILSEIDHAKARAVKCQELAEKLEAEIADTVRAMDKARNFSLVEKVNYDRKEVHRLRRLSASLIDNRLVHLKNRLAIMRTPQLPALYNGDDSIPAHT